MVVKLRGGGSNIKKDAYWAMFNTAHNKNWYNRLTNKAEGCFKSNTLASC